MVGYIYKIQNPNGSIYIGKTFNLKNRLRQYKYLNAKSQPKLYNSLIKYGFDLHNISILFEGEISNLELSYKEIHYIDIYDSYKSGMNCTIGGDSGFMFGDENFAKRPEVRMKMSESKYKFYKSNKHPRTGKSHSDDIISIIKDRRNNQKIWNQKMVLDLENGVFYYGIKELSLLLNIPYKSFFRSIKYANKYKNKYLIC